MAVPVLVPKLGPNMAGGIVAEWYLPDGASVDKGEPVFRLECDYVAVEVEAESAGVLRHQLEDGGICRPGSVAAVILAPGERMPETAPDGFGDPEPLPAASPRPSAPDGDVIDWTQSPSARPPRRREAAGQKPDPDGENQPIPLRRWSDAIHEPLRDGRTFERAAVPDFDDTAFGPDSGPAVTVEPERHVYLPDNRAVEPATEAASAWLSEPAEPGPAEPTFETREPASESDDSWDPEPPEAPRPEPAIEPEDPWAQASAGPPSSEPASEVREPVSIASSEPPVEEPATPDTPEERSAPSTFEAEIRSFAWPGQTTRQARPSAPVPPVTVDPTEAPVESTLTAGEPEQEAVDFSIQAAPEPVAPEPAPEAEALSVSANDEAAPVEAGVHFEEAPPAELFEPTAEPVVAAVPAVHMAAREGASVLFLRTAANVSEAAKMRAQLTREWRAASLQPGDEDIVVRAVARALRESPAFAHLDDAIGLCTLEEEGTALRVLHNAATRQFRDAVADLAQQEARPADDRPCACTVTPLGSFSVDEGMPQLRPGQAIALTMGAVRPSATLNGDRFEQVPTMTLTLAYDAGALPEGGAVRLLARIRDLVEAPYALLVA